MRAIQFLINVRPQGTHGTFRLTDEEFECAIAALIFHDAQKYPNYKQHCVNAANFFRPYMEKWDVDQIKRDKIIRAMGWHMGPFSDGPEANVNFSTGNFSNFEWAVYMADLYSAQRWLQDAEV
jgi:hypothetical protein